MKTKTYSVNFKKLCLRIFLGGVLLIGIFLVTVIFHGYFTASKSVSYLPEIQINELKPQSSGLNHIELKNSGFILSVEENGSVIVKSIDGDTIMSNLTYYASYEGIKEKWGMDNVSTSVTSDSTISITGVGSMGVLINMILTLPKNKTKIDVNIKTVYKNITVVRRESLVAVFDVLVTEVYKKNRQIDVESFDSEYWLQKEGVRFGKGDRSALIYHTPFVSSLQLNTKKNLLFVNLEFYLDHPFIKIPFQEDAGGRWVDVSAAKYVAGDERNDNFSIYFGGIPKVTPRIMLVPNGYLAGYVFTEHADGGNIKTNRAAYFGSENISRIDEASGGFAGHKIPVTKSIFYADPGGPAGSSIRDDPDKPQFLDFLDQLNESGNYDICLHTPDGSNSSREVLEESIKFMKERFDTRTWIDHGMYGGKINRECIVADGLDPDSKYYTADLWKKYDTRYFWSPAVEVIGNYSLKEKIMKLKFYEVSVNLWKRYLSPEEINKVRFYSASKEMIKRYRDKGEMNSLMTYKGNAFATPLYWQNTTITGNFYSWVTDYAKPVSDLSEKQVNVEKKLLSKLISDWGVFINHGYFVRNGPDDDVLIKQNGKLVINPYFDSILGLMAGMRDKGDLYITTVRNLLDYWILTGNVSFDYMPGGVVYINNRNDEPLKGLSLVVKANTVKINGEIPKFRQIGENIIFWFDIPARNRVSLQIELF